MKGQAVSQFLAPQQRKSGRLGLSLGAGLGKTGG